MDLHLKPSEKSEYIFLLILWGENKETDYQDFTFNFSSRVGQKMYFDLCENFKNTNDLFF